MDSTYILIHRTGVTDFTVATLISYKSKTVKLLTKYTYLKRCFRRADTALRLRFSIGVSKCR